MFEKKNQKAKLSLDVFGVPVRKKLVSELSWENM